MPFHWKMWSHQSFAIYWSNDVFMANANILAMPRKLVLNSWNFQMCSHFSWINWRAEIFIINNKIIQEMCRKFEAINLKPLTKWTWTKKWENFLLSTNKFIGIISVGTWFVTNLVNFVDIVAKKNQFSEYKK